MFIALKIKLNGVEFKISIHEVVYIAQTLADKLEMSSVDLLPRESDRKKYEENHELQDESELVKAVCNIIVPFAVGPLTKPSEWLYVASNMSEIKPPRQQVSVNINGNVVCVRLADLYCADFGPIELIARKLYYSTFSDPWYSEKYSDAHDILHKEIGKQYEDGNIIKYSKEIDDSFHKGLPRSLKEFYGDISDKDLLQKETEIRSSSAMENHFPEILERKEIISQNRALFFSNSNNKSVIIENSEDSPCHAIKFEILQKRMLAVFNGDYNFLPKGESTFRSSLKFYNPEKLNFQEVKAAIAKGPSYQQFDRALGAQLRFLSDAEIALMARKILQGERVENCPNYLPNLLCSWFVCEPGRNRLSFMQSQMLLDFMQAEIKYFPVEFEKKFNLYELSYLLRNPYVGLKKQTMTDIYGKKYQPDEWGGMQSMAATGSFTNAKKIKVVSNKDNDRVGEKVRLTLSQQKEGSVILHWLYSILQSRYPDVNVSLTEHDPEKAIKEPMNYNQIWMSDNHPSETVAMRKIQNKLKKKKIKKNTALSELESLEEKLTFIENIIKPMLNERMTSFSNWIDIKLASKAQKQRHHDGMWYTEDVISTLLNNILIGNDDVVIIPQTQLEHASLLNDNLKTAVLQVIANNQHAVIPIHLNGNHWTSMIIKKLADDSIQVIYNDPLGNSLESEINALTIVTVITAIAPQADIIDLQLPQQNNSSDCGPFTVDNLVQLATNETQQLDRDGLCNLLSQPYGGCANTIRKKHNDILIKIRNQHKNDELFQEKLIKKRSPVQSKKMPKYASNLFEIAFKLYPDIEYVEDCLKFFYCVEQSLISSREKLFEKFIKSCLNKCINDYKEEKCFVSNLQSQLKIFDNNKSFSWISQDVRMLIFKMMCKLRLQKRSQGLVLDLNQAWVLKTLAEFKKIPDSIDFTKQKSMKKNDFESAMRMLRDSKVCKNLFDNKMDQFINWINEQVKSQGDELKSILQQLIDSMKKLSMENTSLFSDCTNQLQDPKKHTANSANKALEFLEYLKEIDLLHCLLNGRFRTELKEADCLSESDPYENDSSNDFTM